MANPIEIPTPSPFNSKVFVIRDRQNTSATEGGYSQTIKRGEPFWYAEYTTAIMKGSTEDNFQAFLDKLETFGQTFLAFDPKRIKPKAYLLGGSWGSPILTASSRSASTLTMSGWAANAQLTAGDYISFLQSNRWYLFRSIETKTANGSGVLTLQVKPRPPDFTGMSTALRILRACCEMRLIEPPSIRDSVSSGMEVSMKALQYIERN